MKVFIAKHTSYWRGECTERFLVVAAETESDALKLALEDDKGSRVIDWELREVNVPGAHFVTTVYS